MAGGASPASPPRCLLLGSGEFEPWAEAAERAALEGAGGNGSVAVLATASAPEGETVYQGWIDKGLAHYQAIGLTALAVDVRGRDDAERPQLAGQVAGASLIFFSGGNPEYLARTLEGTRLWRAVQGALAGGATFGGCSAGAMVAGAGRSFGPARGRFHFSGGLGLYPSDIYGVHWDSRFMRLLKPAVRNTVADGLRLVGIAEKTAILNTGQGWLVFGRGAVEVGTGRGRLLYHAGEVFPDGAGEIG
ncbi:MAG: Type 1 glutamine amidotransferase-like domain-containing protein [Candidatus Dormibacteria bacterium]